MSAFVGHQGPPIRAGVAADAGLRKICVQRGDHLRALADRGGDPLDRARADVADREDARQAGFERALDVAPGANKALVVERDAGAGQPVGIGFGADEQEEVTDRARSFLHLNRGNGSGSLAECRPCPSSAMTDVSRKISMFGVAAMRSTR